MLTTKVDRMVRFLQVLYGRPNQHIDYYAEKVGCSSRTIRRYIEDASIAGVPIYLDHGKVGILEETITETGYLNTSETFLLLLSLDALKKSNSDPELYYRMAEAVTRYSNELTLKEAVTLTSRVKIFPALSEEVSSDPKVLESIIKALNANRAIEFTYQKPNEKEEIRKVDPYYLFFKRTDWYLIGNCHLRKELRIFRVGRMANVHQLLETFVMPDNLSIEEYMGDVWELEKGDEFDLEIVFNSDVAPIIMETKYHPLEKKELLSDGSVSYKLRCSGKNEVFRWVLSFGDNAKVIKPIDFCLNMIEIGRYYLDTYRT